MTQEFIQPRNISVGFFLTVSQIHSAHSSLLSSLPSLFLPSLFLDHLSQTGVKGLAWSPTQGLFWGFCLGMHLGVGPFCVQLFAPLLAFSKCWSPATVSGTVSNEGMVLLAINCFFLLWHSKTSNTVVVNVTLHFKIDPPKP